MLYFSNGYFALSKYVDCIFLSKCYVDNSYQDQSVYYVVFYKEIETSKTIICRLTKNSLQVLNIFHDINVTPIHVC